MAAPVSFVVSSCREGEGDLLQLITALKQQNLLRSKEGTFTSRLPNSPPPEPTCLSASSPVLANFFRCARLQCQLHPIVLNTTPCRPKTDTNKKSQHYLPLNGAPPGAQQGPSRVHRRVPKPDAVPLDCRELGTPTLRAEAVLLDCKGAGAVLQETRNRNRSGPPGQQEHWNRSIDNRNSPPGPQGDREAASARPRSIGESPHQTQSPWTAGNSEHREFSLDASVQMPNQISSLGCITHRVKIKRTDCKAVVSVLPGQVLGPERFQLSIRLAEVHLPRMWVEKHPEKESQPGLSGWLASDAGSGDLSRLTRRHGVKVGTASLYTVEEVEQANRLVETGISVGGRFEAVLPLTQPSTRITLSNVPPKVEEIDYMLYASSSVMKCFGCGEEGHLIRACPGRAGSVPVGSEGREPAPDRSGAGSPGGPGGATAAGPEESIGRCGQEKAGEKVVSEGQVSEPDGALVGVVAQHTLSVTRYITRSIVKALETEIVELEQFCESRGDRGCLEALKTKKMALANLLDTKVQGVLVRSRIQDIAEMDTPSTFFFGLERKRGQSRVIHSLLSEEGLELMEPEQIRRRAVDFYSSLFRSEYKENNELFEEYCSGLPQVPEEANGQLERPLSVPEVYAALQSMQSLKAPGIDGLGVDFYKAFWSIVGQDLLDVLNESLHSGSLPLSCRTAVIALLPKKGNLQDIKNWRPVSLLCSDYKILSKALATRLREAMEHVIHRDQTYCVPGRSMVDSIHLIRDILEVSSSLGTQVGLLSLDQEKAFDRVEHSFLWRTMERFGFSAVLIAMIKVLYRDIESVLKFNGGLCAPFRVNRGVRQCCALSGMLYALSLEPLLIKIRANVQGLVLSGFTGNLVLSAYADDVIVFTRDQQDINILNRITDRFSMVSAARVNWGKSEALAVGNWGGGDSLHWLKHKCPGEPLRDHRLEGSSATRHTLHAASVKKRLRA
ncbi:Transposon TX1 uncharacterized 149 kDa protein ORF 2 [Takifugu flavidus]|uniref:Transposon TX1 uncharacterized 149 kDa protein ORF 2 n=1 Tax=Takifugu flavidus TaxID=433684 RepID=A0A5C6MGA2_9TELE|nr:Transposon TX1 uncharacterized 149 kDa protein ORF 2 [Takifugu flavidus]